MKVHVECYAGRKADERPVRFRLENHEYVVVDVLDQWYGPDDHFYKVRADDGNLYQLNLIDTPGHYILRHHSAADRWSLESFRGSC